MVTDRLSGGDRSDDGFEVPRATFFVQNSQWLKDKASLGASSLQMYTVGQKALTGLLQRSSSESRN